MHTLSRCLDCRVATSLAVILVLVLAAGCSTVRTAPTTSAATMPEHASTAAEDAPNPSPPEVAPGETEGEEPETTAPSETVEAERIEYGPFPGEEISAAPHDVLDEVAPEGDAGLEPEPLPAEGEPTYDVPVIYNDRVQFWLDFYTTRQREVFEAGLVRSGRYLDLFQQVFADEGLPLDLIPMAHVESGYKTTAYSRARARGIFQFISGTGKRYGLRIDYWADERLDPEKSARAAAAYLKDLYAEFGDWYLALAAYNAGEGKIRRALARTGRDDFWGIASTRYLRRETKNYVPAILAAILIAKQPGRYGFEYEPEPPLVYESVEIEGAADLQVLARCAGTDLETMKSLNPSLRRYQTPPNATTAVHVPPGSAERTLAELARVPVAERVLYVRHRVRGGDTLYELARSYGVSVSAIQQVNHMGRRTTIHIGDELVIPTVAAGSYPAGPVQELDGNAVDGEPLDYRVRRGDTLSGIASRYRTTASAIAAASAIDVHEILRPGQRLTVLPGARASEQAREATQPDRSTDEGSVHRVRRGENLTLIARLFGTTPEAIASANDMGVNKLLQVGDRLIIPPTGVQTSGPPTAAADPVAEPVMHTVRRGETLWHIASLYDTTVEALCALNRISAQATLYPGTRLAVSAN